MGSNTIGGGGGIASPKGGEFREASYTPDKSEIDILLGEDNPSDRYEGKTLENRDVDPSPDPKADPKPRIQPDKVDDEVDDEKDEVDDEAIDDEKDEKTEEVEDEITSEETQVSFKALNASYPDIFKKFPELRTIIAHETSLRATFPSREDALEAAEKAEVFDRVNGKLLDGDAKEFIDTLRKANEEGFKKFTGNFFKTLKTDHRDQYLNLSVPMIREVIIGALRESHNTGNKDLALSARNFARFAFGMSDWKGVLQTDPEKETTPEDDPRISQLQEELDAHKRIQIKDFNTQIISTCKTEFEKAAKGIFKSIDTENKLTKRQQEVLLTEARTSISEKLQKSPEHIRNMKILRRKAETSGYSKEWVPSLSTAWLGRAKSLLPTILPRLIAEELKIELADSKRESTNKEGSKPRIPQSGNPPRNRKPPVTAKDIRKTGNAIKDTEDFLAAD